MSELQSHDTPLKAGQREFLEEVTRTFKLPDTGKAVRCLINYAREHPDKQEEIFGEVRCLDC